MIWCADRRAGAAFAVGVILVIALAPPCARAAVAPGTLDAAVRSAIAMRAGLDVADVRIDWTSSASRLAEGDSLVGVRDGVDGWTSATVARGGDRLAVRLRGWTRVVARLATRPLAAGARLAPGDMQDDTLWTPWSAVAARPRATIGWEVRRPLAKGARLEWPAVSPLTAVAPGEHVIATWERGGVAVRIEGTAVEGARAGRPIRFRPLRGNGTLAAVAVAPGEVRLSGRSER